MRQLEKEITSSDRSVLVSSCRTMARSSGKDASVLGMVFIDQDRFDFTECALAGGRRAIRDGIDRSRSCVSSSVHNTLRIGIGHFEIAKASLNTMLWFYLLTIRAVVQLVFSSSSLSIDRSVRLCLLLHHLVLLLLGLCVPTFHPPSRIFNNSKLQFSPTPPNPISQPSTHYLKPDFFPPTPDSSNTSASPSQSTSPPSHPKSTPPTPTAHLEYA